MTVRRAGGSGAGGNAVRLALAAAVVALLAVAVLAAGTAGPAPHDPGRALVPVVPSASPAPPDAADDQTQLDSEQPRTTLLQVEVQVQHLVVVGALVAGALLTLLLRRRRTRSEAAPPVTVRPGLGVGPASAAGARPLLDRALAAAQHELEPGTHREPRDAVIACWLRLEEGAAEAGVRRSPAQTPTEFTAELIAGLLPGDAERAALDELRTLYSRARFGSAPPDADAPERAAAALGAVRAGLLAAGPVPHQLAGGPPGPSASGEAGR